MSAALVETSDQFLARARDQVERRLAGLLEPPTAAPPRLVEALRYAVLGPGKRLRPALVVASGEAVAEAPPRPETQVAAPLLDAACSVEMIHTFSLIHDDLPALDDDMLRRGRPTLHVRFDEATAILAGDALLNLAYDVLARSDAPAGRRLAAVSTLCRAVGLEGMISGQVLDLRSTADSSGAEALHGMHALKTGALFAACCEVGGIMAGAGEEALGRLRRYGGQLGLAFQIVDDILDVEGSAADLGKSPGKDARANKATFPALWGLETSRRMAAERVEAACAEVEALGERSRHLAALARAATTRRR